MPVVILSSLGRRVGVVLGVVALSGAIALSPAAARTGSPTTISFHPPGEAEAGASVVAQGRVAGLDGRGSVQAQLLSGGRWRTVSRLAAGNGRFRIRLRLPELGATAALRGVVVVAGRRVATSTPSRVRLSPAAAAEPAPASATASASSSLGGPGALPPVEPVDPGPPSGPEAPIARSESVYWGAAIDPGTTEQPSPVNPTAITGFEAIAGKRPSVLESYSAFFQCTNGSGGPCSEEYAFPEAQLEAIRQRGAIPLFSWASESSSGEANQSNFQLADIAGGKWDAYIRKWATAAREWRHPFLLRFDWEMNGYWYPWGTGTDPETGTIPNGNAPGEYVEAWQHVHDIFTEVGATNATWVWCPYINPNNGKNLAALEGLYPGNEYVDWTCLDGYNYGTLRTNSHWRTFAELFTPQYTEITGTIAPSKPLLIGEVASTEQGGSKATWISEMLSAVPTSFPKVGGLLWFDYLYDGNDWWLQSSTAAEEAFATGIADPHYLAGSASGPLALP